MDAPPQEQKPISQNPPSRKKKKRNSKNEIFVGGIPIDLSESKTLKNLKKF